MIQKINIPKNIPDSRTNDGFRMIPKKIFKQINNVLIYRKKNINIEEEIALENHHKDIIKYKYYHEMFNIMQQDVYNLFNKKVFWNLNMDDRACEHKYTEGKMKGLFCGARIDIKVAKDCKEENGLWRCSKHVSTKVYKPIGKTIDPNKFCIGKTGYKKRFNCNMEKKYGCYCIHHYMENNSFNSTEIKNAKIYYNEINILNNIEIKNTNNSLIKSYNYNCKIKEKIIINDKYERNGIKDIKLITYFEELSDNSIQNIKEGKPEEDDIVNKLKIPENSKKLQNLNKIVMNRPNEGNIHEQIKKIYKDNIELNINIENFKYKLKIIKEILKINPKCCFKNCNKINNINIMKGLYCQTHATDINNNYNKNSYKFNDWNYL